MFLYYLGFRPVHGPELEASWSAISALGQWASVLIGIIIPIILIYIQYQLDKNKEVIGEANRDLYAEFELFKLNIEDKLGVFTDLEDKNGNIVIDANKALEVSTEELKSKIFKFINISMIAKTDNVAEFIEKSKEETFELLVEMLRHDQSISCGGRVTKENMDNVVWTRKS